MPTSSTHYVSLGEDCEVAYQFRRVLGRDSSSFFSWNITPLEALESLIHSGFGGVFEAGNLRPFKLDLVQDVSHRFFFHSPFSTVDPQEDPMFILKLSRHREKALYLIEKFFNVASHSRQTTYFYKTEAVNARSAMVRIRDVIAKRHNWRDNFTVVVLQTSDRQEADWGEPQIANRYLSRFSPEGDATDGHVKSWDRVFREFPHQDPMRLTEF